MDKAFINEILEKTAYPRVCGTDSEKNAAAYIGKICEELGAEVSYEPFAVDMYEVKKATFKVGGKDFPCSPFYGVGNCKISAPIIYLPNTEEVELEKVSGKILLLDGMGYWLYGDLIEKGAAGVVTYNGNLNIPDRDISQREVRYTPKCGKFIPALNIHATSAVEIANISEAVAEIEIEQEKTIGECLNVVAEIKGKTEKTVVFSAHYDSTPESEGAYDNMSGCLGLLYLLEHYLKNPPEYTLKFLFCGGEERGLLGSKAYCETYKDELQNCVLNLNLDMIGSIMGKFTAFASCNKTAEEFLQNCSKEMKVGMDIKHGLRSSDSNTFADFGVPSLSFARYAGGNTAPIHTRYDTNATVSAERILADSEIITEVMDKILYAEVCPIPREIDDKIKEDLDKYFLRKR